MITVIYSRIDTKARFSWWDTDCLKHWNNIFNF